MERYQDFHKFMRDVINNFRRFFRPRTSSMITERARGGLGKARDERKKKQIYIRHETNE